MFLSVGLFFRGQVVVVDDEEPESDDVVVRHVHHQLSPLIHLVKLLLHNLAGGICTGHIHNYSRSPLRCWNL